MTLRYPIQKMRTSATLEINTKVREYRSEGIEIYNFGLGQSPFGAPETVKEQFVKQADRTSYYPSQGIPELREKIAEFYKYFYDIEVRPEQVTTGPGSKELIFHTMLALNSSWYFMSPSWVSYETQANMIDRPFWRVFTQPENDYHLTVADIRRQFNKYADDPRSDEIIMLINYPNNPTGMTLNKDEVKRIARFARNNEIMILSDEIYANITFGDEPHHSFFLEYPEGTIVTGGVSKDRSMGGYRMGAAILPDDERLIQSFRAIASETFSSVAAPIQHASIAAFSPNQDIVSHIRDSTKIHALVGDYVYNRLRNMGFSLAKPEGAFYCFPSLHRMKEKLLEQDITSSRELVNLLLKEYQVATLSGSSFGMPKEEMALRMAYIDYDGRAALHYYRKNQGQVDPMTFLEGQCPNIIEGLDQLEQFSKDYMK